MKKIGYICGSLRKSSYNRVIAESFETLDQSVQFLPIEIGELPLFNEDLEVDGDPATVAAFKQAIADVDGLIIVSPEYNSGIPGVLKNAIDWASRPSKTSVLINKPMGIIGATPGGMGTAFSQIQLRQSLEQIHAQVLPFQKMLISQVHTKIDLEQRAITDEKTVKYLDRYLKQLIEWTNQKG